MPIAEAHILTVEQEVGSEWGKITTDHDRVQQLGTKRPELLREAGAFRESGALVAIDFAEQTKTVQTQAGPRTYHNFYYNGGSQLFDRSNGQQAIPGVDAVQPQARGEDPDRNWRICLQTGGKLAVGTLPLMPVDQRDFETQWRIAVAWAERFFFTERPNRPATLNSSPLDSTSQPTPERSYELPPPSDDIPW